MLFGEDGGAPPDTASRQSQLAFRHGGLGLRSARLHAPAAFWASWADSLSAIQRLPLSGAGPPSWPRARAGRALPASWPCPPTRPQVSMGRRPCSVTCLLTAGSRLPRAAASGEGCPLAREELASVKTAAKTSRSRRRPLKSSLKHVEATAEKARARGKHKIERLEVVANGFWICSQVAVDATLVSRLGAGGALKRAQPRSCASSLHAGPPSAFSRLRFRGPVPPGQSNCDGTPPLSELRC